MALRPQLAGVDSLDRLQRRADSLRGVRQRYGGEAAASRRQRAKPLPPHGGHRLQGPAISQTHGLCRRRGDRRGRDGRPALSLVRGGAGRETRHRGGDSPAARGDQRLRRPERHPSGGEHSRVWMDRDVFHAAGLVEASGRARQDARLVSLNTQYRMRPGICSVVNEVAYPDAPLLTGRDDISGLSGSPLIESSLVLVDTSSRRLPDPTPGIQPQVQPRARSGDSRTRPRAAVRHGAPRPQAREPPRRKTPH